MLRATFCAVAAIGFSFSASWARAGEAGGQTVLLSQSSYWRCNAVFGVPLLKGEDGTIKEAAGNLRGRRALNYASIQPPANWTALDFDDGEWYRAPAPFYGGTGFKQPLDLRSLYLRGKFDLPSPAAAGQVALDLQIRGGVVVYLNGHEVGRQWMPAGKIGPGTPAEAYPLEVYVTPDGAGIKWGWGDPNKYADRLAKRIRATAFKLPADKLVKGPNVLALEMHAAAADEKGLLAELPSGSAWAHVGLVDVKLACTGTARPASATAGLNVWNAEPMQPVFDVDSGDPGAPINPIHLSGTRNGTFSGQVVVSSDKPIRNLKAVMGELSQPGGKAIPAANIQVRYAIPAGTETASAEHYPGIEALRFDTMEEIPSAEVPIITKRFGRGTRSFGATRPIWVTVQVPPDAAPGDYSGTLTVTAAAAPAVRVPVKLTVAEFRLPDPKDFVTFVDLIQSPESVAMYYNVPLWSDEHFRLIGQSMKHMGRIGNRTVYIPLIAKTHFGNEQSMVRLISKGDGWDFDFTPMDKYLDLYEKEAGKPQAVIFYIWDQFAGGGYFSASSGKPPQPVPVSKLDPATGKVEMIDLVTYYDSSAETVLKPMTDAVLANMKKRGLDAAMMIGVCSDVRATPEIVALWRKLWPNATWVLHTHGLEGKLHGQPVGYNATVWKASGAVDPSVRRTYGWQRPQLVAHFHRDLVFSYPITQNRLLGEYNIQGQQRGFGRNGVDFWPVLPDKSGRKVGRLPGRYTISNWAQLSVKTTFLAPGPQGALSTVRFEMMLQGVQECEARIFIEKALLNKELRAKLGEKLAERCQEMLDRRTRLVLAAWTQNYPAFFNACWQDRTGELFAMAAEVARAIK